jgi:predicted permease
MFEEEWADARAIVRIRLVLRTLRGLVWTAFAERIRPGYAVRAPVRDGALRGIWRDVRVAGRGLRRRPGFAATAVLTLALGIGAATAVFTVVDATIVRGLPLPHADRLVSLWTTFTHQPGSDFLFSAAEYADLDEVRSFELSGAWASGEGTTRPHDGAPARTIPVAFTSAGMYELTGARTVVGTLPGEADDRIGAPPVILLSYALWQQQFGSDPSVAGSDASVLGWPEARIVGVLAPDVALPGDACSGTACPSAPGAWIHWVPDPADWVEDRSGHGLNVVALLRAGATVDAARAELASLERTWAERYAGRHGFGIHGHTVLLAPLGDRVLGTARRIGLLLSVASALLLALACANVANLLLARGETRTAEVGVRMALGASRLRVARPVLIEGLLLGLCGGLTGLLLCVPGLPALVRFAPDSLRELALTVDGRAAAFAIAIAALTGVVFATAPAIVAARRAPVSLLRASGRGRTGAMRGLHALIAGQLALATLLLAGAGLLTRSLNALNAVDPGFDVNGRVAFDLRLSAATGTDGPACPAPCNEAVWTYYDELLGRVGAMNGVEGAAIVRSLPLRNGLRRENVRREGETDPDRVLGLAIQAASPNILSVLGIPLREGRDITMADRAGQPNIVLLNESAARALWPGESALGKRLRGTFLGDDHGLLTVVGVYGDTRTAGLSAEPGPELILPVGQLAGLTGWARTSRLVVHTSIPAESLVPAIRSTASALDPTVPVENPVLMQDVLRAATARERFLSVLLGVFAAMALVIAAVGVYGVVAFTVARQSREFAIRSALGAARRAIVEDVLRAYAVVAGAGAIAGAAVVLVAAPGLRAFLYDVAPRDPLVLLAVPAVLITVALLSSLLPALRATRIPPSAVLQQGE